jgi:pyruvate dehydrogenase E1 component alpha subunit
MYTVQVDGMDVLATKSASQFAVDYCKSGKGPLVMETATYRYSGHSMSDPGTSYRTRDEIQEVRQTRDPITSFKDKILTAGLVTAEELKVIPM